MTDSIRLSIKITCIGPVSYSCQQVLNELDAKERPGFFCNSKVDKPTLQAYLKTDAV